MRKLTDAEITKYQATYLKMGGPIGSINGLDKAYDEAMAEADAEADEAVALMERNARMEAARQFTGGQQMRYGYGRSPSEMAMEEHLKGAPDKSPGQTALAKSNNPQVEMSRPSNLDPALPVPSALCILNHYRCLECQHFWDDRWDGEVEDDCPGCGERHIIPIESEDQCVLVKCQAVTSVPGASRS
jgi:hypothetical protein